MQISQRVLQIYTDIRPLGLFKAGAIATGPLCVFRTGNTVPCPNQQRLSMRGLVWPEPTIHLKSDRELAKKKKKEEKREQKAAACRSETVNVTPSPTLDDHPVD